jgi:dihydroneopterin aldolase
MNKVSSVFIDKASFHLPIGLYDGEMRTGNAILISVEVRYIPSGNNETAAAVDYETLYLLMREATETPTAYLETVADNLLELIRSAFERQKLTTVVVRVEKPHPPIPRFQAASVGVEIRWTAEF